jgi:PAS domain S-box-containing protein
MKPLISRGDVPKWAWTGALAGTALLLPFLVPAVNRALFATNGFMPHGVCYTWAPNLLALHVVSDTLIALAYFSIPVALAYFVRKRRDLPFNWMFVLFGVFIVACGSTHAIDVWTIWHPHYWFAGMVKGLTAAASVPTAVALVFLIPHALALPSTAQLSAAKQALEEEVEVRRNAEEALRKTQAALEGRVAQRTHELAGANALLDALFEQAPIGLGFWDRELRFVRLNSALAEMNGVPREAHIGRTVAEVLPEMDPAVMDAFQKVLVTGETLSHEVSGMTPAAPGRKRWWAVTYHQVRAGDEVQGVGAVCKEITDEKEAEVERVRLLAAEREAREEAETANRSKDEFLAAVSHELRAPLNAMVGWVHVLEHNGVADEGVRQAIERIGRNARLQAKLVDDLLDLSRSVTGKLQIDMRRVDPAAVVKAALDTVLPAAAAKSISMSTRFDHDDVRIAADPDRLQQVIWNLVSNAIKFTPAGGTIDVSLSRVSGQLLVTVQDSGQGIDPAFLPYVFDRFRQGRSGLGGRSQPSLGLGLAIARHLVELHGGTLQAESKGVGLGATFTVALPIAALLERTGPAASGSALAVRTASLQNLTVLVVDDDADARQSLKILLESCGARVIVCAGARAALEVIEAQSPDVLVSDVGMPEMDGYALIAARRSHESARGAPVLPAVALTAYGRPEDRVRAFDAGFNAHLTKPVEPEELAAVIRTIVRK